MHRGGIQAEIIISKRVNGIGFGRAARSQRDRARQVQRQGRGAGHIQHLKTVVAHRRRFGVHTQHVLAWRLQGDRLRAGQLSGLVKRNAKTQGVERPHQVPDQVTAIGLTVKPHGSGLSGAKAILVHVARRCQCLGNGLVQAQ